MQDVNKSTPQENLNSIINTDRKFNYEIIKNFIEFASQKGYLLPDNSIEQILNIILNESRAQNDKSRSHLITKYFQDLFEFNEKRTYQIPKDCLEKLLEIISITIKNKDDLVDSGRIIDFFNFILQIAINQELIIPTNFLDNILQIALDGVIHDNIRGQTYVIIPCAQRILESAIKANLNIPSDYIQKLLDILLIKVQKENAHKFEPDNEYAACIISGFNEILQLAINTNKDKKILDIPKDSIDKIINIFSKKAVQLSNSCPFRNLPRSFSALIEIGKTQNLEIPKDIIQKMFNALSERSNGNKITYEFDIKYSNDIIKYSISFLEIAKKHTLNTPEDKLKQILNMILLKIKVEDDPFLDIQNGIVSLLQEIEKNNSYSDADNVRYIKQFNTLYKSIEKKIKYGHETFFRLNSMFLLNMTSNELIEKQKEVLHAQIQKSYDKNQNENSDYEVIDLQKALDEMQTNNYMKKFSDLENVPFLLEDGRQYLKGSWLLDDRNNVLKIYIMYYDNNIELVANTNKKLPNLWLSYKPDGSKPYQFHIIPSDNRFPQVYDFSVIMNQVDTLIEIAKQNFLTNNRSPRKCMKLDSKNDVFDLECTLS